MEIVISSSKIVQQALNLTDNVAKTKKGIVGFYDEWNSQKNSQTLCLDIIKKSSQTKYQSSKIIKKIINL